MKGRFISYLRVSTARQGASGLGVEAQRAAVETFLNGGEWTLLAEYVETESGKHNDRPALAEALAHCRVTDATLVVAKLDRLARNAQFLLSVVEGSGKGGVVFCDLPALPAGPVGKFMLTQMAAVAELEAGLISQRTKDALAAAKARGTVLGGYRGGPVVDGRLGAAARRAAALQRAADLGPMIREMRDAGMTLQQVANAMAAKGYSTPKGGHWSAMSVLNILRRAS